ncbi:hypothetical protein N568_0103290 [Lactococcus garvieae TRF1]|uniref:Uncharacterized protein n=1 Tax=Lactococcus garvieae TRF1 TaxID=1380772 RepID=V8AQL5_9LACT|nr:hypothetical protein N568_0103290 [Lactococcus garvieae TRF1]
MEAENWNFINFHIILYKFLQFKIFLRIISFKFIKEKIT